MKLLTETEIPVENLNNRRSHFHSLSYFAIATYNVEKYCDNYKHDNILTILYVE